MKIVKVPKFSSEIELLKYEVDNDKIYVKYYSDGVQAGFPSPAQDFKEERLSLDKKYLDKPESTFIVRVKGFSMSPTFIPNDLLIVRSDIQLINNGIGIVSVNNTDFTVKRFDDENNCLVPDNTKFPRIELEKEDVVLTLGVVKHLIRDI